MTSLPASEEEFRPEKLSPVPFIGDAWPTEILQRFVFAPSSNVCVYILVKSDGA